MPQHRELGWNRLEPGASDFAEMRTPHIEVQDSGAKKGSKDERAGQIFTVPKAFKLPACLNFSVGQLKKVGKSAGCLSNHVSSAATAWVTYNAESGFQAAPMAWAGQSWVTSAALLHPELNCDCVPEPTSRF